MPSHRALRFKVIVWSNWSAGQDGADATLEASTTFEQTGHEGVGEDVVHPQAGHIDLGRLLHAPDDYTHHVGIDITLESHMTDAHGQPVHARWAKPGEGPNPEIAAQAFCWFVASCGDAAPIAVPHVTPRRVSDRIVRIDDHREVGQPMYIYNLGLVVELPGGPHFITIDPIVTGKGIGPS